MLSNLSNQLVALHIRVRWYEIRMQIQARQDPRVMLLRTIPGVGPVTASAIVATAGDASQFKNGREFAAWLGLTPLNQSSGGKEKLGRITKMGNRYVRRLLVTGMTSRLRQVKTHPDRVDPWSRAVLERKPAPSNVRDILLSENRFGTWFAETIRASGRVRRANRPDTRLLLTSAKLTSNMSRLAERFQS